MSSPVEYTQRPYTKAQVARALGLARGTLYLRSKQAKKDKYVAVAIEAYRENYDTLGHRKLAVLLSMGKNRVMKKYGLAAQRARSGTSIQARPATSCPICFANSKRRRRTPQTKRTSRPSSTKQI